VDKILKEDLLEVEGAHFTIDHWTTVDDDSYKALVLHYISPDWQYKKWTMECENTDEVPTGEEIASMTDGMVGRIPGLSGKSFKVMTTDGAENMRDGMAKSAVIDVHLQCVKHVIDVSIEKALDERTIAQIVQKCKDLAFKAQHRSRAVEISQAAASVGGNQNNFCSLLYIFV